MGSLNGHLLVSGIPEEQKTSRPSDQQAIELFEAMSDLIRVYQFRDRDRMYCHGVSASQCYALEAIARNGTLTLNELAAHLYLSSSTVSRLVEGMLQRGLIERRSHPDDRRACLVSMTQAGNQIHAEIVADYVERERALLAEFDPSVRPELVQFIQRLAQTAAASVRSGPNR